MWPEKTSLKSCLIFRFRVEMTRVAIHKFWFPWTDPGLAVVASLFTFSRVLVGVICHVVT